MYRPGPRHQDLLFLCHVYREIDRIALVGSRTHQQLLFRIVSLTPSFQFLALELRNQEDCSYDVEDVKQREQADCNDKRVFRGQCSNH